MSKRWKGGSTRRWRKVRAYVLDRDEYRCRLQKDGCTTIATQGHHTRPRELVGDDPRYVIAACGSCNKKEGAPDKPSAHDPQPRPRTKW